MPRPSTIIGGGRRSGEISNGCAMLIGCAQIVVLGLVVVLGFGVVGGVPGIVAGIGMVVIWEIVRSRLPRCQAVVGLQQCERAATKRVVLEDDSQRILCDQHWVALVSAGMARPIRPDEKRIT
jgi:hypothetical protein